MNKLIFASSLCLLLLTACDQKPENDTTSKTVEKVTETVKTVTSKPAISAEKKGAVDEAKKITKAFGGALKSTLKAAIKEGGPINALSICNTEATPIAEKAAKDHNALVSRVSLKNRNPANVPNEWQKKVLEDFDARASKGEDIKKMAFAKVVEDSGKKQLRFMKALPAGDLCLTCHGSNIEAKVQAKLTELYPDDKATGYTKGQVRGAVVVIKDIN